MLESPSKEILPLWDKSWGKQINITEAYELRDYHKELPIVHVHIHTPLSLSQKVPYLVQFCILRMKWHLVDSQWMMI